jgi:hypothetical protein
MHDLLAKLAFTMFALAACAPYEPIPDHQRADRAHLKSLGIDLDDVERRVSDRELHRLIEVTEAFDRHHLIRPFLQRIEVRRGDPDHRFGARPMALLDRATIVFWTWEHPSAPEPGSIFMSFDHQLQYFAHELGHLVGHRMAERGRFVGLHQRSSPRGGTHGDFVTAYARTDVEEDLAETFAYVTLGPSPSRWRNGMERSFAERPLLAEKLDLMMRAVAGRAGGYVPVLMTVASEDPAPSEEAGRLAFDLVAASVPGPNPWRVPSDFGGIPSPGFLELDCVEGRCTVQSGSVSQLGSGCRFEGCPRSPLPDLLAPPLRLEPHRLQPAGHGS